MYDDIDVAKGTARIMANAGSGDLVVSRDAGGNLWMRESTLRGNEVVTTVFAMYAQGTKDFVVLESRNWMTGQIVMGEEAYGTCKIME